MGKVSIDLSSLKAAGIYTYEVDNTQRTTESTNALRLIAGFCNKGPFNRPVFLDRDNDRTAIFGDIDYKTEHNGCFFNRMMRTLLSQGSIIAINLLKVNDRYDGPDQVNYTALSVDAATANPKIGIKNDRYGEYDYSAETTDNTIYGTVKGDTIPYVGTTPYSSLYNRSRFWIPDRDLLMGAAARGLNTADYAKGSGTYEYSNLLNFANVGTEEFSILVYKPESVAGYDVTAELWYGGKENIPYGWIRPYDYISDYFLQVVCIKGNWTNYPVLSTDPIWKQYFDKNGVIKSKMNQFLGADGIVTLGTWMGTIIPDFVDKQGSNLTLEKKVNAVTERTGLLMAFNQDAANVLTYDYTGKEADESDPDNGCWGIDIDGNNEIDTGDSIAPYIVDMVGHGAFMSKVVNNNEPSTFVDINDFTIPRDASIQGTRSKKYPAKVNLVQVQQNATMNNVAISYKNGTQEVTEEVNCGIFVDASIMSSFIGTIDSSAFNETNLINFINPNYYIITESGAIRNSQISREAVKVEYNDNIVIGPKETAVVPVSAYLYYSDVYSKITFNVVVDKFINIKEIEADKAQLHIASKPADGEEYYGINFLSYNYISKENDGVVKTIDNVSYFNDFSLWNEARPVNENVKNMFIITDRTQWTDDNIKLGDYVQNITYFNEIGETSQYKVIPGITRVTRKQFIKVVDSVNGKKVINYNGNTYEYNGKYDIATNGNSGFYLITTTTGVFIKDNTIVRQLPISSNEISHSLKFIPLNGLSLSSRHRPGYDMEGNRDIEEGIEKIYGVLEDEGISRGLINKQMVDYRYIVDSFSYGLRSSLGGKKHLSMLAKRKGMTTAVLNLPSAKQFAASSNPYFCDTYIPGNTTRPSLNTKYIAQGGNTEMGTDAVFNLPSEEEGSKFTACFWPHLIYSENGKATSVPPAADCCNVLNRKFTGLNDPYGICANENGVITNPYVSGLEFIADDTDRGYLEPMGVNTIIKDGDRMMIYGNQTAYQDIKSDQNKLHVRENLNTVEIECWSVLKRFNFLYNTDATRANIVSKLTPILQTMQTSGAILKYEIVCDESNNTPDIIEADACVVDIHLWMSHGMERIIQNFYLERNK